MEDKKNKNIRIDCKSFNGITIQKVIVIEIIKGNGTENDPCRLSKLYFDEVGNLLFEQ